jgi:hypothetical protein
VSHGESQRERERERERDRERERERWFLFGFVDTTWRPYSAFCSVSEIESNGESEGERGKAKV